MASDLLVPTTAAVVTGVASFVTGVVLTRLRARLDARHQYQLKAQQRLYEAVGPLRFQLVVSCRELASRVEALHRRRYDMSTDSYFGQNTLYRLLRPLTVAGLIERQSNYVDFSLDPRTLVSLRFQQAAYDALTGGGQAFDGLSLDWSTESQHVFKGRLQAAATLLVVEGDPPRCARFDEFPAILQQAKEDDRSGGMARLASLVEAATSPGRQPVFWCRLVAYGYVANWLLQHDGGPVGYVPVPYSVVDMIKAINDPQLDETAEAMPAGLDEMIAATPGAQHVPRQRERKRRITHDAPLSSNRQHPDTLA